MYICSLAFFDSPPHPIKVFAASMEISQQLFNDSFSYGWSISIKPSLDSLNDCLSHSLETQDGGSFIDMDPDFIPMRWTRDAQDFDFTLPGSRSPVLVHADQLFSNGLLLPLHLNPPQKSETVCYSSPDSVLSRSRSLGPSKTVVLSRPVSSSSSPCRSRSVGTSKTAVPSRPVSASPSLFFQSAPSTPISMSSISGKGIDPRSGKFKWPSFRNCAKSPKKSFCKCVCFLMPLCNKLKGLKLVPSKPARRCPNSVRNSPRTSNAFSSKEWCRGNAETSIYDAILHCKKSYGLDK